MIYLGGEKEGYKKLEAFFQYYPVRSEVICQCPQKQITSVCMTTVDGLPSVSI